MRFKSVVALLISISLLVTLTGCQDEPAYMNPYGEGVDPNTVTTVPFQTRTTTTRTTSDTDQTTSVTTTKPSVSNDILLPEDVPEGHILCPLCQGVRVICEKCLGSKQIKAEIFDENSGVYVRKYVPCTDCPDDPGYEMCELCENKLYVEE